MSLNQLILDIQTSLEKDGYSKAFILLKFNLNSSGFGSSAPPPQEREKGVMYFLPDETERLMMKMTRDKSLLSDGLFNMGEIKIGYSSEPIVRFWFDESKAFEDNLFRGDHFGIWLHERIFSQIYEYEDKDCLLYTSPSPRDA